MPALPTEWSITALNTPNPTSVTLPAGGPQIVHILTSLTYRTISIGGGAGIYRPALVVSDSVAGTLFFWDSQVDMSVADREDISIDVFLVGSPGGALTVAFNAARPGPIAQYILAKGYDV